MHAEIHLSLEERGRGGKRERGKEGRRDTEREREKERESESHLCMPLGVITWLSINRMNNDGNRPGKGLSGMGLALGKCEIFDFGLR